MKKVILAANWKLHKSPMDAEEFLAEFLSQWLQYSSEHEAWFFPPAMLFETFSKKAKAENLRFGLQNFWKEESGAFTGENSLSVAKEMGGSLALIGHSERRHVFGESDNLLQEKLLLAKELGIKPVLCVGETLEQRKSGQTFETVRSQLINALGGTESFDLAIAYEPVWAIGTGEVATPEQAAEVHADIRGNLKNLWQEQGEKVPILYGGSVKPGNAKDLIAQDQIDGFLVGGASLDPQTFIEILTESIK